MTHSAQQLMISWTVGNGHSVGVVIQGLHRFTICLRMSTTMAKAPGRRVHVHMPCEEEGEDLLEGCMRDDWGWVVGKTMMRKVHYEAS